MIVVLMLQIAHQIHQIEGVDMVIKIKSKTTVREVNSSVGGAKKMKPSLNTKKENKVDKKK